jgi:hypothetical protein
MEDLCRLGDEAATRNGKAEMGVKQRPWFPFIPVAHHTVPLLHCMIGLKMLCNIINEFIENMTLTEVTIRSSIPVLRNIIAETATKRDEWDASPDGKMQMTLKQTNADEERLNALEDYRHKTFVDVLTKTHKKVIEQLDKLKQIRSLKVKAPGSIETKMFKVLKTIGVELSSYHGGSLNGKDIKRVMNDGTYVFDELALILKEGKRPDCLLSDDDMDALCLHFR